MLLNQLSDILKKDMNSEEPIIKSIINPNDYIYLQFTALLDNLKNKRISHQFFQHLKEMINNYGKEFNLIVSNIEILYIEEISKKNEIKLIELENNIRENFENEKKILVENINNYKINLKKLMDNDFKEEEYENKIDDLFKYYV